MNTSQPTARAGFLAGALLALLGAVCVLGAVGCTFLHGRAQRAVLLSLPRPRPCALVVVLFRGTATIVRTEFRTMVANTARPGERLVVIDGDSDRELGAFTAPPGPTTKAPAPPTALPRDATPFQRATYRKAVAVYQATVAKYYAGLRTREREGLSSWAATVLVKTAAGNGPGPESIAQPPLAADLDSAVADFSSLAQSGVPLGNRKVVAVVGFQGSAVSAPALSASLQQAVVVVTGFPANPGWQRAYRSGLLWEGARRVVLLTRAVSSELPAVVAGGLAGTPALQGLVLP